MTAVTWGVDSYHGQHAAAGDVVDYFSAPFLSDNTSSLMDYIPNTNWLTSVLLKPPNYSLSTVEVDLF